MDRKHTHAPAIQLQCGTRGAHSFCGMGGDSCFHFSSDYMRALLLEILRRVWLGSMFLACMLPFVSCPYLSFLDFFPRTNQCGAARGWCERHLHEGRGRQLCVHWLLCEWKGLAPGSVSASLHCPVVCHLLSPIQKWGSCALRSPTVSFRGLCFVAAWGLLDCGDGLWWGTEREGHMPRT